MEEIILSLIIIFLAITVIPLFSKKIGFPVIVAEIVFGILLGKSFFNIIPSHSIIDFFSVFGLVYLMFLAGLEIDFGRVKKQLFEAIIITMSSVSVPFLAGASLARYVNVHPLILGTVFSTTSLGLVLPLTKELKKEKKILQVLLSSVILVDMISMFLLAFSLGIVMDHLKISFLYSMLAVLSLFLIPWIINKKNVRKRIEKWVSEKSHFEMEVRFSFALIFLFSAVSEILGFHSIIGAFVAGLIISELTPKASLLEKKLEGFGYGFFIPLFFIFTGAKVNLQAIFGNVESVLILFAIVIFGILSKFLSVFIAAKATKYNVRESLSLGFFHGARLSLIIALADVGLREGFISIGLFSMLIILAVTSAILCPSLGKFILKKK